MSGEPPGGSRRLQEAPGGSRRLQETPGGSRRLQEAPGGSRKLQEAPGGPRRLQEASWSLLEVSCGLLGPPGASCGLLGGIFRPPPSGIMTGNFGNGFAGDSAPPLVSHPPGVILCVHQGGGPWIRLAAQHRRGGLPPVAIPLAGPLCYGAPTRT